MTLTVVTRNSRLPIQADDDNPDLDVNDDYDSGEDGDDNIEYR